MKITGSFLLAMLITLCASSALAQDERKGSWDGGIQTKITTRGAKMSFTVDKKGLKQFSFDTSFYFADTQNYHECSILFSRGDPSVKWTTKGNTTTVIDEYDNETVITKTPRGLTIKSGCGNTAFYKVLFTLRGNRYVGKEIK